jgi:hypothetical protein
MSDVIEHLEKPLETFKMVSKLMKKSSKFTVGQQTMFIITMANPIWEPILMIAERLGLKMPEGPHTRLTTSNLKLIINNSKLKLVEHDYKLLIPVKIPFITNFVNKYLEKPLKKFCFVEYFVLKITN